MLAAPEVLGNRQQKESCCVEEGADIELIFSTVTETGKKGQNYDLP